MEKENYRRMQALSISLGPHARDFRFFATGALAMLLLMLSVNYFRSVPLNNGVVSSPHVAHNIAFSKESNLRPSEPNNQLAIPMSPFPEPAWRTPSTLNVRTVTSTPFARFEIHQVKTESGVVINDWLWTDERSHVNILVHLKEENKYMLFYQRKYGLTRPYYAAIGGLFDVGDTPRSCAARELLEETGLEAEDLVYLGGYRVQVNRGGGILHAFLAKNCVKSAKSKKSDDYENQEKRLLTKEELLKQILGHNVGEAQWLATVATGLLYEDYKQLATDSPKGV